MADHVKVLFVFMLIVVWLGFRANSGPSMDPELQKVFANAPNAADSHAVCRRLSDVTASMASKIDTDGRKEQPTIRTGRQLDDYRRAWIAEYEAGLFSHKVPGLNKAIGSFLDARAGDDPGELTPAKRAAWVKAYYDLSSNLRSIDRSY
jgi:hypothetical protein